MQMRCLYTKGLVRRNKDRCCSPLEIKFMSRRACKTSNCDEISIRRRLRIPKYGDSLLFWWEEVTPLIQSMGNKNTEVCGTVMQVKLPCSTAALKNSTFTNAVVFFFLFWQVVGNKINHLINGNIKFHLESKIHLKMRLHSLMRSPGIT